MLEMWYLNLTSQLQSIVAHDFWILFSVFQGVSSNSSWEQAMKMIINDPRYRYTINILYLFSLLKPNLLIVLRHLSSFYSF